MSLKALVGNRSVAHLTVPPDLPMRDAIRRMTDVRCGALVVVEAGRPTGILSRGDILRFCLEAREWPFDNARVSDAMTPDPIAAENSEDIGPRLDMMRRMGIGCLPVIEEGNLTGVLFLQDLLDHQIAALGEELEMLRDYVDSLQDAIMD